MERRHPRLSVCVLTGGRPAEPPRLDELAVDIGGELLRLDEPSGADAADPLASFASLERVASPLVALDALRGAQAFDDAPAIDPLLRDALFRQGKATDFFTGEERERVRFHLFGVVSERSPSGRLEDLLELCEAIAFHELPFVVHAILDGVHMPARSAWPLLEELEARIEHKGGVVGTVMGSAWALDRSFAWERTLACYEAVVRGDVDVLPSVHAALQAAYQAGHDDASLPPVRIGAYRGLVGDLCAELPGGAWEWHGEEVGLWLGLDPDEADQLVAALLRTALPEAIERLLTLRGRAVHAFSRASLASLTPLREALGVRAVVEPAARPRLFEALVGAGLRALHLVDPRVRARAERSGLGEVGGVERASVERVVRAPASLSIAGPPPELPVEVVFEAMQAALERGEAPPARPEERGEAVAASDVEGGPDHDPLEALLVRAREALRSGRDDVVWLTADARACEPAVAGLAAASRAAGVPLLVVDATEAPRASEARRAIWIGADDVVRPEATRPEELGLATLASVRATRPTGGGA